MSLIHRAPFTVYNCCRLKKKLMHGVAPEQYTIPAWLVIVYYVAVLAALNTSNLFNMLPLFGETNLMKLSITKIHGFTIIFSDHFN